MRHTFPLLITVLLLALAAPVLADEAPDETPPPSYTGSWVKNKTLSDDPAQVMGGRTEAPGSIRGGGMRGSGRRSDGMGRAGLGKEMEGDRPDGPQPGAKTPMMMKGLERLEIFREGDEFAVTDATDILQSLFTDGRRIERWTPMGQVFETAKSYPDRIVVRSEGKDGRDRTVTYTLSEQGRRLTVVHEFKPPRSNKTVTLKMVYDRAE